MLDYRTLPFIASQSPYLESLRPDRQTPAKAGRPGRGVRRSTDGAARHLRLRHQRLDPARTGVPADGAIARAVLGHCRARQRAIFRVYFLNDRGGIYALGYPVITHVRPLDERGGARSSWPGCCTSLVIVGATIINASHFAHAGQRPRLASRNSGELLSQAVSGVRAGRRGARSSFWRSRCGPISPTQLRAGIEEAAAKTALVAQRLVEDYATLQQRGAGALVALDDQIMVLVRRAIDQDVNLFDRRAIQATSERDLFASGLLSMRTPADVYRRIVLDRLPTFVGEQEVGAVRYRLAAAPVRAGGHEGIVTVP